MNKLMFALFVCSSVSALAGTPDKSIYGRDSRIDINVLNNSVVTQLSKSVAVMIENYDVRRSFYSDGKWNLDYRSLKEELNICSNDRFAKQQAIANCTGFLVAPNLLATAGHCVNDRDSCLDNKWVFDYVLDKKNDTKVDQLPDSSVYSCKRVIKYGFDRIEDWSVIELDRAVEGRKPLVLSQSTLKAKDDLFVIGAPSGVPLKFATGKVRDTGNYYYFRTNLDTFGGNSGSPVFNMKTGHVEGILVRGDVDYERKRNCNEAVEYGENRGRGEDVSYITDVAKTVKAYKE